MILQTANQDYTTFQQDVVKCLQTSLTRGQIDICTRNNSVRPYYQDGYTPYQTARHLVQDNIIALTTLN